MEKIIADPDKSLMYNKELMRLSSSLHSRLKLITKDPRSILTFHAKTVPIFFASIDAVSQAAYRQAIKNVNVPLNLSVAHSISRQSRQAAILCCSQMGISSKNALDISSAGIMSPKRVASKERALAASSYQLRLAFFLGTTRAWELNSKAKKLWMLSAGHDKDDTCDDNADEGPISIFDFFSSGVMYCPAHIGCNCRMALILSK